MKKILTILLVLVSLTSFSQSIWRNSELEKVVFDEINIHRQSVGSDVVVWDNNNRTALPYSELLTSKIDENNKQKLVHCACQPGSEILIDVPAVNYDNTPRPHKEIAEMMVYYWNRSPIHKTCMEYNGVVRAFVAIQMYVDDKGVTRALAVVQFRYPIQYYIDGGYGKDGENQDKFTPKGIGPNKDNKLKHPWVWVLWE
tara:strand:+ start:719 stop:1315 length:597 start_codon:yes stop_codon:yes gene_type:complete